MKTHWITHSDQKILFLDYSGFGHDIDGVRAEVEQAVKLAQAEPPNSVLTLTDVRETKASPEMVSLMKESASRIAPYARRRAVVGVSGVQRVFLDMINKISGNKTFVLFDDLDTAKAWLTKAGQ